MTTRAIIVGADGTDSSNAAVDWAAGEARRRDLPLRIVHAFDWEWREARFDLHSEYIDIARKIADAIAGAAEDRARKVAPDLAISTDALVGHAAPRLLEVSRDAAMLVVGSHGRGGFTGLLLGSVSQRVATHAPCPMVVVRGRDDVADGPVVAGVDDSPMAGTVLAEAFATAARTGCPLTVVRAYLPVIPLWLADVAPASVDTPDQDAEERAQLDRQLAPWRTRYPDVPLTTEVTHRSAAAALTEASRQARLVVVGSRGHGVVAGSLLGSAGLQLLHHAGCPVMVVRPGAV
ncbi:universal stress protein [Actinoplanes sp. N902-109]|uniref:universal stress protein n=1 Tax=Actinoplanes sp. (strain N902-109) TaxID=649831 RepID=UPI0003294FCD|nr:universal stress protein [Actinoplanes sp. N902-109]AGL16960.1 hypothetical protein L083_3450 [Actinoplanes sp. N902-109]